MSRLPRPQSDRDKPVVGCDHPSRVSLMLWSSPAVNHGWKLRERSDRGIRQGVVSMDTTP
jgi:hypothetical protein